MEVLISIGLAMASFGVAWVAAVSLWLVSSQGTGRRGQFWSAYFEPDVRGLRLLKDWLSPAQLECYERHKYFDVIGSDSSKVYRIYHGHQANIEQLDIKGQAFCRWCFVPEGRLVTGDVMLAQKIALETDESGVLGVANRFTILGAPSPAQV